MDKLLAYLNSLPRAAQIEFAESCNTSVGYLRKACSTGQKLNPELCVAIERKSKKEVTRQDLRENWRAIWPELATRSTDRRTGSEPGHVMPKKRRTDHKAA